MIEQNEPPKWALYLLLWICRAHLFKEIEDKYRRIVSRISDRKSSGKKYLSNFDRYKVTLSSSKVFSEIRLVCLSRTSSNVIESFYKAVLMIMLVSTTMRIYFFFNKSSSVASFKPCFSSCSAVFVNKSFQLPFSALSVRNFRNNDRLLLSMAKSFSATSSFTSNEVVFIFFNCFPNMMK